MIRVQIYEILWWTNTLSHTHFHHHNCMHKQYTSSIDDRTKHTYAATQKLIHINASTYVVIWKLQLCFSLRFFSILEIIIYFIFLPFFSTIRLNYDYLFGLLLLVFSHFSIIIFEFFLLSASIYSVITFDN